MTLPFSEGMWHPQQLKKPLFRDAYLRLEHSIFGHGRQENRNYTLGWVRLSERYFYTFEVDYCLNDHAFTFESIAHLLHHPFTLM